MTRTIWIPTTSRSGGCCTLGTDGKFWQPGNGGYAGWTADVNTRMNTVSSIERQIKVLPAIVLGYDGDSFEASLKGGVGYFFQEIDDDAPKLRGFDRTGLRQTTFGESLGGRASVSLGSSVKLSGTAQGWWDSGDWLETEYGAEIRFGIEQLGEAPRTASSSSASKPTNTTSTSIRIRRRASRSLAGTTT